MIIRKPIYYRERYKYRQCLLHISRILRFIWK